MAKGLKKDGYEDLVDLESDPEEGTAPSELGYDDLVPVKKDDAATRRLVIAKALSEKPVTPEALNKYAAMGGSAIEEGSLGLANMIPGFKARNESLKEKEPLASSVGGVMGAFSPQGLGGRLATGIFGLGSKALKLKEAPGVIKSAALGAAALPAISASQNLVREIPGTAEDLEQAKSLSDAPGVIARHGENVLNESGRGVDLPVVGNVPEWALGLGVGGAAGVAKKLGRGLRINAYDQAFPDDKNVAKEAEKFESRQRTGQVSPEARGPSRTDEISKEVPIGSRRGTMDRANKKIASLDNNLSGLLDQVGVVSGDKMNNWNVSRAKIMEEMENHPDFQKSRQRIRLKAGPEATKAYDDTMNLALGGKEDFSIKDLQDLKRGTAWGNLDDKDFQAMGEAPARKQALKDVGRYLRQKIEDVASDYSKEYGRADLGRQIRDTNRKMGNMIEHIERVVDAPEGNVIRSIRRGGWGGAAAGAAMAPFLGAGAIKPAIGIGGMVGLADYLRQTAPVATSLSRGFGALESSAEDPSLILNALSQLKSRGKK